MKKQQFDPRFGRVSASAYEAAILCPGKPNAEKGMPDDRDPKDDAMADFGETVHAILAGAIDREGQPREVLEAVQELEYKADLVFNDWVGSGGEIKHIIREDRFYLRDGVTPWFSGQADDIRISVIDGQRHALIRDYKSLYGEHTVAAENPQLRSQAVLLENELPGFESITVCIVQRGEKPDPVTFMREDLVAAGELLLEHRAAWEDPEAPRIPGEKQCMYCKARATCPEANTAMQEPEVNELQVIERWDALAPERKAELFDAAKTAQRISGEIVRRCQKDLEAGEVIGDLELKPGNRVRQIADPQGAFREVATVIPAEEFAACCDIKIGKLENAYRAATACTIKEAKEAINSRLEQFIEMKENRASVKKKKGAAK